MSILFNNSFDKLPDNFYSKIEPEKTKEYKKIIINSSLCKDLGVDFNYLNSEEGLQILSGNHTPENAAPLAMVYAGHQFGNWVPQLGDGRAVLLGELLDKKKQRFDFQLKGSGKTPYSRGGDGKAWLGPVIREYIISEYMNNINIPTTRSLAAMYTGEDVYREQVYPGAVLCRVAKGHIRVGTFQYFLAKKDFKSLKILADYFIDRNLAHLKNDNDKYHKFFISVVNDQVKLVALWMKVGFIHGVMNTDNTSISCETIDYGPCAFMDVYKSDKVYSSIDTMGRYSYKNQPNIIMWNMACFASTLLPLLGEDIEKNTTILQDEVSKIPEKYKNQWLDEFSTKLGFEKKLPKDESLINEFLNILETEELDFTNSFRSLLIESTNISKTTQFKEWEHKWKKRLDEEDNRESIKKKLNFNNPAFIMRNHLVENIIQDLLKDKKDSLKKALLCLEKPYEKLDNFEDMYLAPTKEQEVFKTFCGT